MNGKHHWLLPEGIEEILPPDAARLEACCRRVLDLFQSWGYELVMPPLVEYLESLLTGTGEDLDLQTFKVTDQLTGRMMGIRADTTPQVARIDAHYLKRDVPTRLCYLGQVLHTRPATQGGTRTPLQLGAELYGHAGPESDAEILSLMLRALQVAGVKDPHVDLGHVGIYRGLVGGLQLSEGQEAELFDALQRKSVSELESAIRRWSIPAPQADGLVQLVDLNGDAGILGRARGVLSRTGREVTGCLDALERIAALTRRQVKEAPLFFDLAELRGYHYHTGMMFSAYVPAEGQAVARGGRYDHIGAAFGRPRPATGFSTDLKLLFALSPPAAPRAAGIFAPHSEVPGLFAAVEGLRRQGETVVTELPGQRGNAAAMGCDRELALEHGRWIVRKLNM